MNRPLLNDPEKYAAFVAKIPMGRWGELHEIKGAAVFLASDACRRDWQPVSSTAAGLPARTVPNDQLGTAAGDVPNRPVGGQSPSLLRRR
jgi:hypothetical protein